jgi:hypothetical protein
LPSARRHGISDYRMRYVVRSCPLPLWQPGHTGLVMFLSPDQHGVPLEVVVLEDDAGELTIIHAMRLRASYREAYRDVMKWL